MPFFQNFYLRFIDRKKAYDYSDFRLRPGTDALKAQKADPPLAENIDYSD